MQEFWYWETTTKIVPDITQVLKVVYKRTKWLLVKEEDELIYKFNLTKMNLENINTFSEFEKLFGRMVYSYNKEDEK